MLALQGRLGFLTFIPPQLPVTTNPFELVATERTITEIDFTNLVKIGSGNLDSALAADIARIHDGGLSAAMQDLQDHLTVGHASGAAWAAPTNPTAVRATITSELAAFTDENRTGASSFIGNRFTNRSNPSLSLNNGHPVWSEDASDTRFPGKNTFFTGRLDVSGNPPLTLTSNKIYLFEFYIDDQEFNSDVPVLKLGTRRILGVTRNGLTARVGNSDGNPAEATFTERLSPPGASSTIQYLEGMGANSVEWFVPDTLTFPWTLLLE